jgi:hypothetical protein
MSIHQKLNWESLTPEKGNFLFGYYDRQPWNESKEYHLALKVPQQERLPEPGEKADVGIVAKDERKFCKLAETEAWCHQQGSMSMWLTHRKNTFIYNDFVQENGAWRPITRIYDLEKGADGHYDFPVYTLSPDGRWAAVLNFFRIPRRGYSYARAEQPFGDPDLDLDNDGLFIMDMISGECRLIASYRQLIEKYPFPYWLENHYIWLNHAIFNSDSTKVMILFRHSETIEGMPWSTDMFTMDIDGGNLRCPLPSVYWSGNISHQIWGHDPKDILVDARWTGKGHQYVIFDETLDSFQARLISDGMGPQGHLIFSPDGKWMAADTYPDEKTRIQKLALVKTETGEIFEIGDFMHKPKPPSPDVRCDLHPRWSSDGMTLTVDTVHEGDRKIYMLELEDFYKNIG